METIVAILLGLAGIHFILAAQEFKKNLKPDIWVDEDHIYVRCPDGTIKRTCVSTFEDNNDQPFPPHGGFRGLF